MDLRERLRYFDYNPVWVKNLRQAGRSWIVPYSMIGTMGIFLWFMFAMSTSGHTEGLGHRIFTTTILYLSWVTYLGVPLYLFVQNVVERTSGHGELSCITAMSPKKIMQGKVLSALTLNLSLFSTAIPFLVFSVFLRGVDLVTILLLPAFMVFHNLVLAACAIAMGSCSFKSLSKVILSIVFGIPLSLYCIGSSYGLAISGLDMTEFIGSVGIIYFLVVFLIYAAAFKNGISAARDFHRNIYSHPEIQPCQFESDKGAAGKGIEMSTGHTAQVVDPASEGDGERVAILMAMAAPKKPPPPPEPKTRFQKFLRYHDINPVLVKDARQAVQSTFVPGGLLVLSTLFLLIIIYQADHWGQPGRYLFSSITRLLSVAAFFGLPGYVFYRTHMERTDGVVDLMFITAMEPPSIMLGKVQGCLTLFLNLYSSALPFLVAAFILNGTDLPTLAYLFPLVFFPCLLLTVVAIALGLMKLNLLLKITAAFLLLGFGGKFFMFAVPGVLESLPEIAENFLSKDTLGVALITSMAYALIFTLVYLTSVGMIRSIHRRSVFLQ